MDKKIKYVIFDCDGVLVDSEYLASLIMANMLQPYGFSTTPHQIMTGYVGMKDVKIVETLCKKHSISLPTDFMQQYETTLDAEISKSIQSINGIEDVLKSIHLPKAIVSNSSIKRIKISTGTAGLLHYFGEDRIFSADTAKAAKPDPRIYQFALSSLNIKPEEAIVIEDSPTGTLAASGAGISVIGFMGASHGAKDLEKTLLASGAEFIAKNSDQLSIILKEICG